MLKSFLPPKETEHENRDKNLVKSLNFWLPHGGQYFIVGTLNNEPPSGGPVNNCTLDVSLSSSKSEQQEVS